MATAKAKEAEYTYEADEPGQKHTEELDQLIYPSTQALSLSIIPMLL